MQLHPRVALLQRRDVASCAPPQQNIKMATMRCRPLCILFEVAAAVPFPYFQA
jgi:hypothetical protein